MCLCETGFGGGGREREWPLAGVELSRTAGPGVQGGLCLVGDTASRIAPARLNRDTARTSR